MPPASKALRLQLELDSPAEPIQGRIGHLDDGERIAFTGWLELMAAIERLTVPSSHSPMGHLGPDQTTP